MVDTSRRAAATGRTPGRWRTVDIVVASVVAVAFGLVFAVWNNYLYTVVSAPLSGSPAQPLLAFVWLVPGVVGGLVVRRPGAALYTEFVAATVSLFFGSAWGLSVVMSGVWQGLGAELVLAALLYRRWGVVAAALAGVGAGLAMGLYESVVLSYALGAGARTVYVASAMATGAVAGLLAWWLVRSLARTGVLAPFAAGRAQQREV
jgi:energy-coupling factor transport system substrate-specific component